MAISDAEYARWLANPKAHRCVFAHLHYLYAGSPCPSVNVFAAANGASATADATAANSAPSYAIDGDRIGQLLEVNGTGHWGGGFAFPTSSTLTVTPSGTVTINRVVLAGLQDTGNGLAASNPLATGPILTLTEEPNLGMIAHDWANGSYIVQYSTNGGGSWTTFITVTGNTRVMREHKSGDTEWTGGWITGNKFRITVTAGLGRRPRIAEFEGWTPDPLVGTLYLAEEAYFTEPADTPASTAYRDCIARVPNFERSVDLETLTGPISSRIGELILNDSKGELDALLTAPVDGQECEFFLGDPSWSIADILVRPAFTAIMEKVTQRNREQKVVKLRVPDVLLDATVAGKILASGQRAPVALGAIDFGEAVPEDISNNKYRFADRAYWYVPRTRSALLEMFDEGVSLNGATFTPTAAAPTVPQYYDYSINAFRNGAFDVDGSTPTNYPTATIYIPFPVGTTVMLFLWVPNGVSISAVYGTSAISWTPLTGATLGSGGIVQPYWGTVLTAAAFVGFSAILSTSSIYHIQAIYITGTDKAGPDAYNATTGSGATMTAPSVPPTVTRAMLRLNCYFSECLSPATNSTPSGMTEVLEGYTLDDVTPGNAVVMSLDTQSISATSGVGVGTKTSTNSNPNGSNVGFTFLFKGTALSINTGTGTWTAANHGLINNDILTIRTTGTYPTTSPQIVSPDVNYAMAQVYVGSVSGSDFKLYTSKDNHGLITVSSASFTGDLTFTARRYWDNGDGSALLVATPAGTVHAKFVNDQVGGYGAGYRASDFYDWAWMVAAALPSTKFYGAHASYPVGDVYDPPLGGRWAEPTKVKDILNFIARSSNSAWGFTALAEFMFLRLRTNPLLLPDSPSPAFNTSRKDFTDDDVMKGADVSIDRAIPRYKKINGLVSLNYPPLTQVGDIDSATAAQMRRQGTPITSEPVADGTIAQSPARYHNMIDSEVIETMLPNDPTYYLPWANFLRDRQYPWLEYRNFVSLTDAVELELGDYTTSYMEEHECTHDTGIPT